MALKPEAVGPVVAMLADCNFEICFKIEESEPYKCITQIDHALLGRIMLGQIEDKDMPKFAVGSNGSLDNVLNGYTVPPTHVERHITSHNFHIAPRFLDQPPCEFDSGADTEQFCLMVNKLLDEWIKTEYTHPIGSLDEVIRSKNVTAVKTDMTSGKRNTSCITPDTTVHDLLQFVNDGWTFFGDSFSGANLNGTFFPFVPVRSLLSMKSEFAGGSDIFFMNFAARRVNETVVRINRDDWIQMHPVTKNESMRFLVTQDQVSNARELITAFLNLQA